MVPPPGWVTINGREVDLYTYKELDKIGTRLLRERALRLKRLIGKPGERIPEPPEIPQYAEGIVKWMLTVQAQLTELTVHDFGMPLVCPRSAAEEQRFRWLEFARPKGLVPPEAVDADDATVEDRSKLESTASTPRANSTAATPRANSTEEPRRAADIVVVPLRQAAEFDSTLVERIAKWETDAFGGRTVAERLSTLKLLAAGQEDDSAWCHLELYCALDAGSGEALGTASLVADDIGWKRTDHGLTPWLSSVYVRHCARRRGVGRTLVEAVASDAVQRGHNRLFLYHCPDLRDDNGKMNKKLTEMYQRWGFVVQKGLHRKVGCSQVVVMRRNCGSAADENEEPGATEDEASKYAASSVAPAAPILVEDSSAAPPAVVARPATPASSATPVTATPCADGIQVRRPPSAVLNSPQERAPSAVLNPPQERAPSAALNSQQVKHAEFAEVSSPGGKKEPSAEAERDAELPPGRAGTFRAARLKLEAEMLQTIRFSPKARGAHAAAALRPSKKVVEAR